MVYTEEVRGAAVVTGATSVLGRSISLSLKGLVETVYLGWFTNKDKCEKLADDLRGLGANAIPVYLDVSCPTSIASAISQIVEKHADVKYWINNAGVRPKRMWSEIDESELDRVFDVCIKGTFNCLQIVGQRMKSQGSGVIINMSSTAALNPFASAPHYVAAKAAIIGLTKAFALCLAPNVRVNCIAPGIVGPRDEGYAGYSLEDIVKRIPLERIASPDEIASAVRLLLEAKYATGHIFVVDGGLTTGIYSAKST